MRAITAAMTSMEMMTTRVEVSTSSLEGQLTFFSSSLDSLRNSMIFFNPGSLHTDMEYAGQAGFEPATSGFGDRRSTN